MAVVIMTMKMRSMVVTTTAAIENSGFIVAIPKKGAFHCMVTFFLKKVTFSLPYACQKRNGNLLCRQRRVQLIFNIIFKGRQMICRQLLKKEYIKLR